MMPFMRRKLRPRPSTPPAVASTTLSTRNCRDSLARDAPSADRTATSRCRTVPRASSRFATFVQAMSSTKPTAPSSNQSVEMRFASRKLFFSGSTLALHPVFELG